MGLRYLNGSSWDEVTREERFFCAHLFQLIEQGGVGAFVAYLNRKHAAGLPEQTNGEIAYEACFYRDLRHFRGGQGPLISPSRTFDLALLSDQAIVIIEAKAQQPFDEGQLAVFERAKAQVAKETGVKPIRLAALASSLYSPSVKVLSHVNGPYLTWLELAALYDGDTRLPARRRRLRGGLGHWGQQHKRPHDRQRTARRAPTGREFHGWPRRRAGWMLARGRHRFGFLAAAPLRNKPQGNATSESELVLVE